MKTEHYIRTWMQCPQKAYLGSELVANPRLKIFDIIFTTLVYDWIEQKKIPKINQDLVMRFKKTIALVDHGLTKGDLLQFETDVYLRIETFLSFILRHNLVPIDSYFSFKAKILNDFYQLSINAIFKHEKNNSWHIYSFSPIPGGASLIATDPIIHLKTKLIYDYINSNFHIKNLSPKINHHIFSIKPEKRYEIRETTLRLGKKDRITSDILNQVCKAIEHDIVYPVIPCPDTSCQVKDKCPAMNLLANKESFNYVTAI